MPSASSKKDRPAHRCAECGVAVAKWVGQCPQCQAWGSIEQAGATRVTLAAGPVTAPARPIAEIDVEAARARPTGVDELDRVLGGGLVPGGVVLLAGEPGVGKALALDTPVATPSGWTTMETLRPGDLVLGASGQATRVVATSDVMIGRPCFEIVFNDGAALVADEQHQWETTTRRDRLRGKRPSVRTTGEMATGVRVGTDNRSNHAIRVAEALKLPEADLLVPPYTLGAWLGDGASAQAVLTSFDPEILMEIEAEGVLVEARQTHGLFSLRMPPPRQRWLAPRECEVCPRMFAPRHERQRVCSNGCIPLLRGVPTLQPTPRCQDCGRQITGADGHRGQCASCSDGLTLKGRLATLKVLRNKHIPQAYLRASEDQRRALLAGLLDTDGYVTPAGCVQLGLTNERLADDAYELIVSLGYKAARTTKSVKGRSDASSTCFITSFSPPDKVFRLPRKAARINGGQRPTQRLRYVVDVTPVPTVPVRCIQVEAEDGLFLAGRSMIPTHNSTLLSCVSARAARDGAPVLYVTGEESAAQVRLRAERTGDLAPTLWLAAETDLAAVIAHVDAVQPELLVVDSVQTIASGQVDGTAGGVTQVRAVAAALIGLAKERGIATVLVGHVTKDGAIAGPRLLEHLVDVVLHFEGDRHSALRLVRAVKNRFGPADEVGCFSMTESGIEGLADPSGLFLSDRTSPVAGTCVTVTVEGRRPMLAEVQSLVASTSASNPRRAVSGLDSSRVAMVLAIVERRGMIKLADKDVYTATVGGMRLTEPSVDLAVALAVASAEADRPIPVDVVVMGELALSGELRKVSGVQRRLAEAARLGYTRAIVPVGSGTPPDGMRVLEARDLWHALEALNGVAPRPIRRDRGALTLV